MIVGSLIFAAGLKLGSGWLMAAGVVQFIWSAIKAAFIVIAAATENR